MYDRNSSTGARAIPVLSTNYLNRYISNLTSAITLWPT